MRYGSHDAYIKVNVKIYLELLRMMPKMVATLVTCLKNRSNMTENG